MPNPKIGVLLSGRGSNFEAILVAIANGSLKAEVAVVISNRESAGGIQTAKRHHLPTHVVLPSKYSQSVDYDQALVNLLVNHQVDVVVLAGYMKLVGAPLLDTFDGRMVNIHPSLLPSFKGLHAQQQALDYGVKFSGCTAHYVIEDMDAGPIIMQAVVPVLPDDSVDSLSQRILEQEHVIFPQAIQYALDQLPSRRS